MAFYYGEQDGLPIAGGTIEYNWHGRWEFTLDKTGATTYSFTFKAFIALSPGKKAGCNESCKPGYAWSNPSSDTRIPRLSLNLHDTDGNVYYINDDYGPYGPVTGGNGWYQFRNTKSGSFSVTGSKVIIPYMELYTGSGSSYGTGLYAIDTWRIDCGSYAVTGVTKAIPSNPRCTGKTSSSISMTFDIDWGGESSTFDPACVLRNSSGTEIAVIRNGTSSATFTGLSRYTPYYIVGYACNSVGGGYTNAVLVYTNPENPTVSKPTVSNSGITSGIQGVASIKVTPGVVTDNGGKAIETVETYIRGGQYGSTLTSIGTGTAAKTLSNLLPNTQYNVITRASNGITESYSSYTTFTTLGNPPEFTDIYASNLSLTGSKINYTAKYEYNAKLKEYKVQWRYPGSSTWTTLSTSTNTISGTNFDSLTDNKIEYRVTITDNWNRSTTSNVLTYTVLYDYSNDITNLKYVANSDDTYTISGNWTNRLYTKIDTCLVLGSQAQQEMEIPGNFSDLSMNSSGFTFKTKEYKNKHIPIGFLLYIITKSGAIYKPLSVPAIDYSKAITLIGTSNKIQSDAYTITKNSQGSTEKKKLREHDIIKLSRFIRYIDLDSRGTSSNISISKNSNSITIGRFVLLVSYSIEHISRYLYSFYINSIKIKTNDGSKIRIRNNNLSLIVNNGDEQSYRVIFNISNVTVNSSYQSIDVSNYFSYILQKDSLSTNVKSNITIKWLPEYDYQSSVNNTITFSKTINCGNSDMLNNHLVSIKVYDKNGTDLASGKTLTLTDGSDALIYNEGNPTNGTTDSNKFIYSENGLPLRLDLGAEYEIDRIEIQRRILTNNVYSRNYIIGRNEDKEICYIFYDSLRENTYIEADKVIKVN